MEWARRKTVDAERSPEKRTAGLLRISNHTGLERQGIVGLVQTHLAPTASDDFAPMKAGVVNGPGSPVVCLSEALSLSVREDSRYSTSEACGASPKGFAALAAFQLLPECCKSFDATDERQEG
jgi:hypothetical protein